MLGEGNMCSHIYPLYVMERPVDISFHCQIYPDTKYEMEGDIATTEEKKISQVETWSEVKWHQKSREENAL